MVSKEKIAGTLDQHKANIYLSALLLTSIGYLAGSASLWFLVPLVIPAFILWISVAWLVRGGFMLAVVMNKGEQVEEMNQWLEGPLEKAVMEKRKNGSASSSF